MRRRRRTAFIVLVMALLLGVAACGGTAGTTTEATEATQAPATTAPSAPTTTALEVTTLKVGVIPIGDLLQAWVADSQGYFTDEGLTVEFVPMAGGAAIAPAVESGEVDLGASNVLSLILAHDQGFEFQYFTGSWLQAAPDHWNHALLVPVDSTIQSASDLKGTTVAVNTLGNINELMISKYLTDHGLDPDVVNFTEVPFPDMPAALEQGRVDASVTVEPFVTIAVGNGSARILDAAPYASLGDRVLVGGYFSTKSWLDAHPNTAAAFDRAIVRATEYINADPVAATSILPNYTKLSEDLAATIKQPIFGDRVEAGDIQPWIDNAVKFGFLDQGFAPNELLWP